MNKKISLARSLFAYLKEQRFAVILTILFISTFAVVFFLYGIDLYAVWYPALLSLILALVFFILGFFRFNKIHKALEKLKNNPLATSELLPLARSAIEQDYHELLIQREEALRHEEDKNQAEKNELSDYYTAWMHQIKNPISVIQLTLQQEDAPLNKELLCELFIIEQYVEMALHYIRLLESGSDLLIKEYSLDDIIRKTIRKYAAQFIRKRIRLVYNGTDKRVITDEKWLSFIIEQLLSNAIKYTNQGFVHISISNENLLTVSDSGIGISPEDLPRIFEKGFTGYNGRLDKKSTGIGLYLCKKAATKLAHALRVTSVVGQGSSFYVDLSSYPLVVE